MKRLMCLVLLLLALFGSSGIAQSNPPPDVEGATQTVQKYVKKHVGAFDRYQHLVIGNPVEKVAEVAGRAKKADIPESIMQLALYIALAGFIKCGWDILINSGQGATGLFFKTLVVGLLLSISFSGDGGNPKHTVSYVALQSWGNAVNWSSNKFSTSIDQKMQQSSGAMVDALARSAVVATGFGTMGGVGMGVMKAGGAAVAKKSTVAGGKTLMKGLVHQLKISLVFMTGLIVAYANIIYVSGLIVLSAIYIFPLAVAGLMWNQSKVLWSCVGSFLSCWMIAMILPLITYMSIDRVFVEPARMAATFEKEMGVSAQITAIQTSLIADQYDDQVSQATQDCRQKQEANPELECLSNGGENLKTQIWKPLMYVMNGSLEIFKFTIGNLIDSLAGLVLQVFFGFVFYVLAIGSMFIVSTFVAQTLGSAASNLGNSRMPSFSLPSRGRKK